MITNLFGQESKCTVLHSSSLGFTINLFLLGIKYHTFLDLMKSPKKNIINSTKP